MDVVTMADSSQSNPDLLIDLRDVSVVREGRALVGPLSWQVELDERWVILGPNGAGKTTLLSIAAGGLHPTSGSARLLDERLGSTELRELSLRIGVSSPALAARVPDDEIVCDVVISAGYAVVGRWRERYDDIDRSQAIDTLESMGAEHLADRRFGTLSEGERKRVLIARALMTDPELLLFDEPAAGLDLGGREELVERLGRLAQDPDAPATVLITHHVEEIPEGFTHAMLLAEGKVVAQGLLDDVLTAQNLSTAFSQRIALDRIDGRFFARRQRAAGGHRRA
ncbi:putative ABC transporter ATP-binding protein [Gordonia effusa NBRC 100432]|uniref:Putative ABC transporter ATP-binding protein n=1 Tax=Gordonia effusa NBRC 100432 TaxID=1077974 RepID=H0R6X6_9ACTN|nr:ABC transporter ATP-binding protein [Gordonia effusa]GAB20827.1 putative ABC transporter ATP-binding protein [Gordonia effusa NBRC 100432]